MDDHDEEKKTEHNLIVYAGESEAEVLKWWIIEDVLEVEANYTIYRHEGSRGLLATAELLVTNVLLMLYNAVGSAWK